METTKCKLVEYRNEFYLVFSEKRDIKTDDRVLTPMHIALQRITGPAGTFDLDNFYSTNHNCGYLYGPALSIVAATENEILPEELAKLKQVINCLVLIKEGIPCFKDGKIVIRYT